MSELQFDHKIINSGDWSGSIDLKNFQAADGIARVNKELFFRFSTPEEVPVGSVNVSFNPWVAFDHKITSTPSADHGYNSDIDITIQKPHNFHAQDVVTFYINGGLGNGVGESYVKNLSGFVDEKLDPDGGGGCENGGDCGGGTPPSMSCFDDNGSGGWAVHSPTIGYSGI